MCVNYIIEEQIQNTWMPVQKEHHRRLFNHPRVQTAKDDLGRSIEEARAIQAAVVHTSQTGKPTRIVKQVAEPVWLSGR